MRALLPMLLVGGLCAVFGGCAGVGIVATSNPVAILRDATDRFERRDSPVIAEKLIRQALVSYQKNNDQLGLASAYRTYGFFFRSAAVEGNGPGTIAKTDSSTSLPASIRDMSSPSPTSKKRGSYSQNTNASMR